MTWGQQSKLAEPSPPGAHTSLGEIPTTIHPFTRWLAQMIARYDLVFLVLAIAMLAFISVGFRDLTFSSDNRNFFGGGNPEIAAVRELEDTYSNSETVLFALVSKTDGFTPETLTILRDLTEASWQLPYVLRVQSLANYNHTYADGDDIVVEPLIPLGTEIINNDVKRIKSIAMESDELVDRIVSADGRAFGIFVNVVPPDGDGDYRSEIGRLARDMKAEWQARAPDLEVVVSGGIIAGMTFNEAAKRDIINLIPLAFVVVSVLMILGLGTVAGWLGTTLVTVGGTVATLGFAGWSGIALIPATAVSPLSVMVLVSASCVHLVLSWTRQMAMSADRNAAVVAALEENLAAVAVTNITTAIGFLCLNFAESPPLAQMGNIVAFGIIIGWLLTSLVLPAVLKRFPDYRFSPVRISPQKMEKLAQFSLSRTRSIIGVFSVLAVFAIAGLMQITFNDNPLRYFDESFEFRRDSQSIEANLTGMETVQFSLESADNQSAFSPEFLVQVDQFAHWVRSQDQVVYVGSLTDIVKRLNQTLGEDRAEAYRIADTREANAQAMMFYELSLPIGQDMNQMLDIGRDKTRLVAVMSEANGQDIRHFARTAEEWLTVNTPAIATKATGVGVAFAELSRRNNEAMLYGMVTVLILVSAVMMITLRDVKLGALSLIPNVLPAILGFGLWGWLMGEVNLGSTVVTTMTFGIVVDDTVHILMHYQRARRSGANLDTAMRDTFSKVGTALVVTSIAIVSGFVIMTQSGFAINKHVGGLTAIVILVALLTDLVLLPAVLKRAKQ